MAKNLKLKTRPKIAEKKWPIQGKFVAGLFILSTFIFGYYFIRDVVTSQGAWPLMDIVLVGASVYALHVLIENKGVI